MSLVLDQNSNLIFCIRNRGKTINSRKMWDSSFPDTQLLLHTGNEKTRGYCLYQNEYKINFQLIVSRRSADYEIFKLFHKWAVHLLHKWGINSLSPTLFLSSTEIALASLRNIALPHKSSRSDVNWWYFHFLNAHAASWNSRSLQLLSASNNGLTEMQAITRRNSQNSQKR